MTCKFEMTVSVAVVWKKIENKNSVSVSGLLADSCSLEI